MVKLLLLLLLVVILGGVVNGDKQEAPVLRLVLSQSQQQILREAGREEGGEYYVICGYREGGRGQKKTGAASGLWSKSLADVGEMVLVPHSRQGDGVEDCTGAYWGGYDELEVGEKEEEEDSIKNQEDEETDIENERKSRREAADNIGDKAALVESENKENDNDTCDKSTTQLGDWVVAVQTCCNLLFFFLLPFVTRMGYFGQRGKCSTLHL